jgi:hypothetical protein
MFVSLVYCAESTVRWFVVREKHCWMAADSADNSKEQGGASITCQIAKLSRSSSLCHRRAGDNSAAK